MNKIIEKIQTLLNSGLSGYKKVFYGENLVPAQSIFPFVEIVPLTSSVSIRGTGGLKDNTFAIKISIKDTLKKYYKAGTNVTTVNHAQTLVKRMEERNSDGTFKDGTIMQVLSDNLKLGGEANIIDDFEINYDEILPFEDSYIIVGSVTFNVQLITPN